MNRFVLLGIVVLLALLMIPSDDFSPDRTISHQAEQGGVPSDYPSHPPILITHDSNLTAQGWPGDGSAANPFLIENLSISYDGDCISISNTRKHILIRNCQLESSSLRVGIGISLNNVTGCIIQNCTTTLKVTAYSLVSCINCSLSESTSIDNTAGLEVSQCNSTNILDNHLNSISVDTSYDCSFERNMIHNGDSISSSGPNVTFYQNEMLDSGVVSLQNTTFLENRLGNSGSAYLGVGTIFVDNILFGTDISHIDADCRINGNWIMASSGTGIYSESSIPPSHYTTLFNNTIAGHPGYGLRFYYEGQYYCKIYGNRFGWNGANADCGAPLGIEWDDGVSQGNAWHDYGGSGPYIGNGVNDSYPTLLTDYTTPLIDQSDNLTIEAGTSGHEVVWNASDNFPHLYEIYLNRSKMRTAAWFNGTIRYPISFLDPGVYNYTLKVDDAYGHTTTDTIWVTVIDSVPPSIDAPPDIEYEGGSMNNEITWSPSDVYPDSFILEIDGNAFASGEWVGGPLTISVDGLLPGLHTANMTVYDTSGNCISDLVLINVVDTVNPTINSPPDTEYESGETGNNISWAPADLFPSSYEVYRNGSLAESGVWDGNSITVSVDGLGPGRYNYTLCVNDTSGNSVQDTVWVNVVDTTAPLVDSPEDIIYEAGEVGHSIYWNASEINPASYTVYVNGSVYETDLWDGHPLTIYLFNLAPGNYNFTILLSDSSGNQATDMVNVIVSDTTIPSIIVPTDVYIEEKTIGHTLTWDVSDSFPSHYELYVNGTRIRNDVWNGSDISIGLDGLSLGNYNYTILVWDTSGNLGTATTIVHVIVNAPPQIDSPEDVKYRVSDGIGFILWHPYDTNPSTYEIYRNQTLIRSGLWNGSQISVNVSGLSLGIYNYTLVVEDIAGRQAADSVFVYVVVELVKPTISSPEDIEYVHREVGNIVVWSTYDEYPWLWKLYHNGILYRTETWNSSTISISVDGLDVGWHNMTLVVIDQSWNQANDTVRVHVLPLASPEVSGPATVEHTKGDSDNILTWDVSSPAPSHYEIFDNEVLIEQEEWDGSAISFDLDRLSVGHHTLKLVVYDLDGNSAEYTTEVEIGGGAILEISPTFLTMLALIAGIITAAALFRAVSDAKKDERKEQWQDLLEA